MKFAVGFLIGFLVMKAYSIESPCPGIFDYITDERNQVTFGRVNIFPPVGDSEVFLEVDMRLPLVLPTKVAGKIHLPESFEKAASIMAGQLLEYDVFFPLLDPIPTLNEIRVNGQSICNNSRKDSNIHLNHKLVLPKLYHDEPLPNNSEKDVTYLKSLISGCGKLASPMTQSTDPKLISTTSEWPWLAVIFTLPWNERFLCTGTLISVRHVLTAASCLPDNDIQLTVSLGVSDRNNLRKWGSLQQSVLKVRIPREYNQESADDHADIALLTLERSIQLSPSIRPLCLMNKAVQLNDLKGELGFLVGWGTENDERELSQLTMIRIPIADENKCSKISKYMSEMSFCGGHKEGNGVCDVDVGNGLVFHHTSSDTYYLQGIVTRFSSKKGLNECAKSQYIVFTDVAKYSDWIKNEMAKLPTNA